jgi:hypothetical protein
MSMQASGLSWLQRKKPGTGVRGANIVDKAPSHPSFLRAACNAADADFVRVLEDLIDTLILKNVIQHTDLPPAAQRKILMRKGLRNRLHGALNLLGGDDRIL